MIKVNVVAVGRVKEKYFSDGINEYIKRLSKFCEFNLIEVKEENFTKANDGVIEIIKQREAQRIAPYLKGKIYCMAIEGKKYDSVKFSKLFENTANTCDTITFVIGGSYGIDDAVKKSADGLISFSDMTFPHTMFRLMLTEQIYRAFTILNGIAYHK